MPLVARESRSLPATWSQLPGVTRAVLPAHPLETSELSQNRGRKRSSDTPENPYTAGELRDLPITYVLWIPMNCPIPQKGGVIPAQGKHQKSCDSLCRGGCQEGMSDRARFGPALICALVDGRGRAGRSR
jgi:hypothetical protein